MQERTGIQLFGHMSKTTDHRDILILYYFRLFNITILMKSTEINVDEASKQQLAAQPAKMSAHPDEEKKVPLPNIIPDGVSPSIQHPLDPLNAGKNEKNRFILRNIIKNDSYNLLFR